MKPQESLDQSLGRFNFSPRQQIFLLLCNYFQFVHLAAILAVLFTPWAGLTGKILGVLFIIYLLPALLARLVLKLRPIRNTRIPLNSSEYFTWWLLLNLQMLFCRLPFLEECLRCVPTLYSNWLRLWGAKIGKHTYWAAGLRILDRSFLDIGDGVVFGAGVRLNPHVVDKNELGELELLLADIVIRDHAVIGGYSLLTAGTVVEQNEVTKAILLSPPFSRWVNGKRVNKMNDNGGSKPEDAN